eukprot:1157864-Pelagomonas_calceolata.AAC.4
MHCTPAAPLTAAVKCCGHCPIHIRPAAPGPLILSQRALRRTHSSGLRPSRKFELGDGWCTQALAGGAGSIQGDVSPSNEERAEFSKDIFRRILTFMGPGELQQMRRK